MKQARRVATVSRRYVLGLGMAGILKVEDCHAAQASNVTSGGPHFPFGPLYPTKPAPAIALCTHTGLTTEITKLLVGHISAIQLMFTGCSATCPIQGALFCQAQRDLGILLPEAQFVSITIDPLSDGPSALAAWLRRFDAKPGWLAVAPRVDDVDRLVRWLYQGGQPRFNATDPHAGQVYLVNKRGELAYRTTSMPPSSEIVEAIRRISTLTSLTGSQK